MVDIRDPRRVDIAAAGLLAAVTLVTLAARHVGIAGILGGVVAVAPVATRRRAPVASVTVAATGMALLLATDAGGHSIEAIGPLLAYYTLGRSGRRVLVELGLLAVGIGVIALGPDGRLSDLFVTWALFVAGPFAGGRFLASRAALTEELDANARRLQHEQEARARSAAAEERTRIARELHDVIAHSVSVMVIQTAAAREVATIDRDAARRALTTVQASGREALLEMRRMIGVLRHGDIALAGTGAPGLAQLELLGQRARQAGLPVEIRVQGTRRELPESVDLVAFRVVQEALTNTLKHAGRAHAEVYVTFGPDALELDVSDDGVGQAVTATGGGGYGLLGMRERLQVHGGELTAGPRRGGGFRVQAWVPVA